MVNYSYRLRVRYWCLSLDLAEIDIKMSKFASDPFWRCKIGKYSLPIFIEELISRICCDLAS